MKNYGVNLELEKKHQKPQDHVFGAFSAPCLADIPETDREKYLPVGERQNIGEEKMDCATRGPINILETKFNFLLQNNKIVPANVDWLNSLGFIRDNRVEFSDRFIAIKSGTTAEGNSLIAPLEAIRTSGLIPKKWLPQVPTFGEYHNPASITNQMDDVGKDFKKRFPMKYERVFNSLFSTVLQEDLIDVAGHAWPLPVNGIYPAVDDPFNHCFVLIKKPKRSFDNYIDSVDGDFIKDLSPDYKLFDYGYRLYIPSQQTSFEKKSLWQKLKEKTRGFFHDYHRTFGADRSSHWDDLRLSVLEEFPFCQGCGSDEDLEVHHIKPFHLFPALELQRTNVIVLCGKCHILLGHLKNFKSYNIDVQKDASYLLAKIKSRP